MFDNIAIRLTVYPAAFCRLECMAIKYIKIVLELVHGGGVA